MEVEMCMKQFSCKKTESEDGAMWILDPSSLGI